MGEGKNSQVLVNIYEISLNSYEVDFIIFHFTGVKKNMPRII